MHNNHKLARDVVAAVIVLLCVSCSGGNQPLQKHLPDSEAGSDAPLIEKGKYLAAIGNCISCHTRKGVAAYSGGVGFETPFGVIYSTNITPEPNTGIGRWTKQDLRRAMHEGIGADGKHLFPAFPYPEFTRVSDDDVDAIYAFLRTLAPVSYTPPDNGVLLRIRWPLAVWNELFFRAERQQPDATHDAEWDRGAYLVEGLGHCSACHGPRNFAMAEKRDKKYAGGLIEQEVAPGRLRKWSAVNLTPSKRGLGSWSVSDITQYLRTGFCLRAGTFGPMNEVIINSLRQLTAEDARAMATYIKSLPVQESQETVPASDNTRGSEIYASRCEKCHGSSGRGGMFSGPPVAGSAVVQSEEPSSLINLLLYGPGKAEGVSFGKWESMQPYGDILDDAQIADVSNYVRTSWGNRAPAVEVADVAKQR